MSEENKLEESKVNEKDLDKVAGGIIYRTDEGYEVRHDETGELLAKGIGSEDGACSINFFMGQKDYTVVDVRTKK